MPLINDTKILGIDDAKVSELTVDNATTITYLTGFDVPGIRSLKVTPQFLEKELRGDEEVLDQWTKLDRIQWSFENAKLSLSVLGLLLGGTVVTSGTAPAQKSIYTLTTNDKPKFFKLEGVSTYTDVGDVHITLFKCKASTVDYTLQSQDFALVSCSGYAIGTIKDKKVKEITLNETAVPIT